MTVNLGEGDLYVRPVDDATPWKRLGRGTTRMSADAALTAEEVAKLGVAMDRFVTSMEVTLRLMMNNRQVRAMRRRMLKGAGPRPLAPGCLPASKLARRGWR